MNVVSEQSPPAGQNQTEREQFRQQIRQTIEDARRAAQEAAQGTETVQETRIGRSGGTTITVPGPPPIPGIPTTGDRFRHERDEIPPHAVDMVNGFFVMCVVIAIGWPLARAFGRRIERGSQTPVVSAASAEQMQRIEQAVEAIAIEVERISESQRFMARLQNGAAVERQSLKASDAH